MSSILDLQKFAETKQAIQDANNPLRLFVENFSSSYLERMKKQQDEERKKKNIVDQMSTAQKIMDTMSGMPNQSSSGKASSIIDDKAKMSRIGVVDSSSYIPTKEFYVDENGAPSLKIGFKTASPTEQNQMVQLEQTKRQMRIDQEKQQFNNDFITGNIPDGAYLKEMGNLGLNVEDYQSAKQLRDQYQRMTQPVIGGTALPSMQPQQQGIIPQSHQVPEGYQIPGYEKDKFGNVVAKPAEKIPASDIKAQRDMENEDKAGQEKIVQAKANAESAINSINEIRKTMGYFGRLDANLPSTPGTAKVAWSKNIDRIKGMLTLDKLMELKNASKNGASGMGALSDGERFMLQDAASALDKGLPQKDAERYLNDIEKTLTKVLSGQGTQSQSISGWNQTSTGVKYKVIQ